MGGKKRRPIFVANSVEQAFDLIFYGGQFWYFNDGCYRSAEMEIRNFVQSKLKADFSSHFVREVFYVLESRCFTETINTRPRLINLKNGVYDWIEDRLYPHTDVSDRFIYQLPVNLNRDASCPRIDKFLNEVLRPEDRKVLLQFLGYSLVPTTRFEKAVMLVGDGANGKSTYLKTLIELIGRENISTLSLHDLSQRFRLAEIVGKLANVFPDLPYKRVEDASVFKAIVSGDPITGERKYGKPFSFQPFTKLIFSTNNLPVTQDISPAYFRRWLIVEFPNSFHGKDRDTGLLSKLTTREELEGLLLLAISGLKSLREAEEFSESQGMRELKAGYERSNNPVCAFIGERCELSPEAEIKKVDLYKAFKEFVCEEKLLSLGRNDFAKELRRQVPSVLETGGEAKRWRGITVKAAEMD